MESIEALRGQLDTLEDLGTVVRTMKALSAASIRQYERASESLVDYTRTVELGLHVVLRDLGAPAEETRSTEPRACAVVFGSDHGLCGRFNEDVVDHALDRRKELPGARRRWPLLVVGARPAALLEDAGEGVEQGLPLPGSAARIAATVQRLLLAIEAWRREAAVTRVDVFHNRPRDGGGYEPVDRRLIPVDVARLRRLEARPWPSHRLPVYHMDPRRLLARLLRQHFFVTLFQACAESQAAEHAGRLSAMQSAERNLDERRDELTTRYRRVRQAAITGELLDVTAGFEALS